MANLTIDTKQVTQFAANFQRQMPFVIASTLNDLAFQVQRGETASMADIFKHPRPFTAKSTQVNKATKGSLSADVFIRPEVAKYLLPYEFGGVHVLPGKALLDPVDIRLDQYGQLPKNAMNRLKARGDIFIGTIQTKAGPIGGVWQRMARTRTGGKARRSRKSDAGAVIAATRPGDALKLLIRFGTALPVKRHLGFRGRARAILQAASGSAFASAISKALSSMR